MDLQTSRNYLPSCWQDDIRMNALFTVFRSESVNPEGWRDKMDFWINTITDYSLKTRSAIVSINDLCQAFERNGMFPQCLDTVLDYMLRQRLIVTLGEYEQMHQSKGWLGWGFNVLVQKPLSWGFGAVQNAINRKNKEEKYVVVSAVKDLALKVHLRGINIMNSNLSDRILYLEHFKKQCKDICNEANLKLALLLLQHEKKLIVEEVFGQQVVRFQTNDNNGLQPLTDVDKGILRLKEANIAILKEIDAIESEIEKYTEEAKNFVKNGFRTKAMIALKKRKRLESMLKKKTSIQDNIEIMLSQLLNTDSEKMVLDAYSTGAATIKKSVSKTLTLDNLDAIMAEFEEAIDDYAEVQETIAKSVPNTDLDELELELEELLAEREGEMVIDNQLPSVPVSPKLPASNTKDLDMMTPEQIDQDIMMRLAALRSPLTESSPISDGKSVKKASAAV